MRNCKLLYATAGRGLPNIEIARRVHGHAVRTKELANESTTAAKFAYDLKVISSKSPDLMIGTVS